MTTTRCWPARLAWLAFALVSVALMAGLLSQRVDAENRALKVPGGDDARLLAELFTIVPDDPVLALACVARTGKSLLERERELVRELADELGEHDGVVGCEVVEPPDPGVMLLAVSLARDEPIATAPALAQRAAAALPPTLEVLATGLPLIEGRIAQLVAGERTTIVPLLMLVLFSAAWLVYRRISLAAAVLLPAVSAIAWTGGAVAWLGHELDPVASLLDPVLLTIGVAASAHFVEAFRRLRANTDSAAAAARAARDELRRPACWATTTTMLGLWSLCVNDTPAVVDFGVRAALGVALTHLFTFVLLPAWLVRFGAGAPPARDEVLATVGARWRRHLARARGITIAATAAAVALALVGVSSLRTENDPLSVLPADDPVRAAHDRLAARLGGVETFHLLVREDSPAEDPSRLLPFVAGVRRGEQVAGLAGPVRRGAEGGLAVPLLLRPSGSTARTAQFARIDRAARVLGLDGVAVAGRSVRIARDSVALMHGLLGSLGVSLLLLTSAMAIGLGSLRLAAVAMVPGLLPSLWLYGGLGLAGRPLSVATAMIGCTMLGLIVDNTLHLLHKYRAARSAGHDRATSVASALGRCGRAVHISSGVLLLGFATAGLSRLSTTVEFALLATATIAMAWFCTAVLLPTMLLGRARNAGDGEEVMRAG